MHPWQSAFDRLDARTARDLAQDFGTPFILIDEASLDSRRRLVEEATAGARLFLPYKASPLSHVRRYFAAARLGAEVASGRELAAATAHGIAADSLILNQPARDATTFRGAIALGATVVADGVADIRAVAAAASRQRAARVLLRVRPGQAGGTGWSRFGMPVDGAEFAAALALAAESPSLEVVGLHCHLGTNISAAASYGEAAGRLAERWRDIERVLGRRLEVIDFGGGFATPASCPLHQSPGRWRPDGPGSIVAEIRNALATTRLLHRVELWLEPGRILVEDSAVLVTRVVHVREGAVGRQVTCDSGVHQVPTANWLRHPVARVGRCDEALTGLRSTLLCGALCMETDIIRADCALPADLAVGDLLKVGAVGCYDLALAFEFIHGHCPVLLQQRAGNLVCLRRRQSCDDSQRLSGMRCAPTC
jgi:diaminopimelate decarboxylase